MTKVCSSLLILFMSMGSTNLYASESVKPVNQESFCGLVRSVFYQRVNFQTLMAQVTLTSDRTAVRVRNVRLSKEVLVRLGEQKQALENRDYLAQVTSVMQDIFIQVCFKNLSVYDEEESGHLIRSGHFDSVEDMQIFTL